MPVAAEVEGRQEQRVWQGAQPLEPAWLEAHNTHRKAGSQLQMSEDLATEASLRLAKFSKEKTECQAQAMAHPIIEGVPISFAPGSQDPNFGVNTFAISTRGACAEPCEWTHVVDSWLAEGILPDNPNNIAHRVQAAGPAVTKVGCARLGDASSCERFVCLYSPRQDVTGLDSAALLQAVSGASSVQCPTCCNQEMPCRNNVV
jgi:hypothetical protein